MDALETILSRRNVRTFKSAPVPEHLVTEILQAAMAAPSAGNQQPWHFVVITASQTLDAIRKLRCHPLMPDGVRTAILVCGDISLKRYRRYWIQGCAAATENILLAAHALGLGGVWMGLRTDTGRAVRFRDLFDLPQQLVPFALVAVGYPAEHLVKSPRFNSARVHYEQWT